MKYGYDTRLSCGDQGDFSSTLHKYKTCRCGRSQIKSQVIMGSKLNLPPKYKSQMTIFVSVNSDASVAMGRLLMRSPCKSLGMHTNHSLGLTHFSRSVPPYIQVYRCRPRQTGGRWRCSGIDIDSRTDGREIQEGTLENINR